MILIRTDEFESILVCTIIKITIFAKYAFLYAISTQFQFWLKIYETEAVSHAESKSSWANDEILAKKILDSSCFLIIIKFVDCSLP